MSNWGIDLESPVYYNEVNLEQRCSQIAVASTKIEAVTKVEALRW
jgi:hypothetical protein